MAPIVRTLTRVTPGFAALNPGYATRRARGPAAGGRAHVL